MVSPAEAAKFRRANQQLQNRIERDVRRLWTALDASNPEGMRDALLDYVPGLVDKYGQVAAVVAAEYFEETTGVSATVADTFSAGAVQGSVRYYAGGLWTGEAGKVLAGVTAAASRHMLQFGRTTIYDSTRRHSSLRYARVPEPGACSWCLMLSSRGAAYASEQSAGGEGNDYHDDCGCDPVAVRDDSELPYDYEDLYEKYTRAREADIEGAPAGYTDKAIAARMRNLLGTR